MLRKKTEEESFWNQNHNFSVMLCQNTYDVPRRLCLYLSVCTKTRKSGKF